MGRRDAVQVILEVVAECRRLLPGLIVTYEPGWETRGNGTSPNYDFGNWHHTASATSAAKPFPTQTLLRTGRVDLAGPLCNFAGPWCTVDQPRLHVMAANPANHAGASRASGPVPALALYNPRTLGIEIDYAGSSPMTSGQELVAKVWGRAVAKVVGGGDIEHVRAHAETSITGKWDPGYAAGKTIDMAAFRRSAANLTPQQLEDDMPLTDADVKKLMDWPLVVRAGRTFSFGQWLINLDDAISNTKAAVDVVDDRVDGLEAAGGTSGAQPVVNMDAAAVAAALAADQGFLSALARAVNDDAAARLKD